MNKSISKYDSVIHYLYRLFLLNELFILENSKIINERIPNYTKPYLYENKKFNKNYNSVKIKCCKNHINNHNFRKFD